MTAPLRFYPAAGVVVYEGESPDHAFQRAARARARATWQRAAREVEAQAAAAPWWEEVLPEGRS